MSAGHSHTPLLKKLGIKSGQRLIFINPPDNYGETLGPLPQSVEVSGRPEGLLDFIQLFTARRAELETEFPRLKDALSQDGMLWISWPKRSSKVSTDLTQRAVMEIGLGNGLVDVKVCAVDETWSTLKFVRRVKDRGGPTDRG